MSVLKEQKISMRKMAEVAGVTTTIEEPEVNETEDYKENDYGKKTSMFATMKKPKATIIV